MHLYIFAHNNMCIYIFLLTLISASIYFCSYFYMHLYIFARISMCKYETEGVYWMVLLHWNDGALSTKHPYT